MSDTLIIKDLVAECRLGVLESERQAPQTIWIDLDVSIDAARAAAHDAIEEAVDYARLVSEVRGLVARTPYRLLERVAEDVAALVLKAFAVPEVRVRIKKRALPGIDYAAVEVRRRRAG